VIKEAEGSQANSISTENDELDGTNQAESGSITEMVCPMLFSLVYFL